MENEKPTPKTAYIDFRAMNNAFIHNLTSSSTKVTKRCICIPLDDNFISESSYISRKTGKEVRTAIGAVKMWPIKDEDRAAARERGVENPKDYNLRLDISDKALKELEQRDPALAARINYRNNAYDKEAAKSMLPYIGTAYEFKHRELPPEEVGTAEVQPTEGNDELPY